MKPRRVNRPAAATKGRAPRLTREQRRVAWGTLAVAVIAVLTVSWRVLFPIAPDRVVKVAWTHECGCARGWIRALRDAGFVVHDFEMTDLRTIRRQWRVPSALKGCHPAHYLGYVIEGHVPAEALRKLAAERPQAVALVQSSSPEAASHGGGDELALSDLQGALRPWP